MMASIKHRGPDDDGLFCARSVSLGFRRLSIIDLSTGHQPISNEDGSVTVICNGEIYNHLELQKELVQRGHRFATKSDVEVIVHGYEEHGAQVVKMLRGMFGFALWDSRRQQLVLARDRLGKKPMYYAIENGRLFFASEIKALLASKEITAQVDEQALVHFLTFMYSPGEMTLFRGIRKLLPGHVLIASPGRWRIESYWDIPLTNANGKGLTDWLEETEHLLAASVQSRLMSDVPLGAFISGGIDSSLIMAFMHHFLGSSIKTFSVGFEEEQYSELQYAKLIAQKYETEHHELIIRPHDLLEHIPEAIWFRDEPLANSSDVPLLLLSKLAAKHVKVVLSGEGGDELFAGYPKHVYDRLAGYYQQIPRPIRNHLLTRVANNLPFRFRRAQIALRCLNIESVSQRWNDWFAAFDTTAKKALLNDELQRRVDLAAESVFQPYLEQLAGESPLKSQLYLDTKIWLPDNLLMKGDKMTMAASIEGRTPFLDHKFVEFAFSIPDHIKLHGLTTKFMLRKLAEKYMPSEILARKKVGFVVPIREWFRLPWGEMTEKLLLSDRALQRGYFRRESIFRILKAHREGKRDHQRELWTLLNLEIWHRLFIDGMSLDKVLSTPS